MSDLKISQLSDGTAPQDADEFPVARSSSNFFLTWAYLKTALNSIFQPLDSDLTAIAALDASTSGAIASDGSGWIKKTYAQFKTALSLVASDVGLGSVTNDAQVKLSTVTTKGDLLVASGSAAVARLGVGSDTQVLTADSASTNGIKWAAASGGSSPLTTKGDLFGHSTVDARIPIGSDHQVLTAASGQTLGLDWEYPPGYEIGYDEITSPVNVTATSEASSTTIISCAAHTFDGAPIIVEFFAPAVQPGTATNEFVVISLWEGATELGELANVSANASGVNPAVAVCSRYRFTPSAASHTYTVKAYCLSTTGTPKVFAGSGGVAGFLPAFARFTKV